MIEERKALTQERIEGANSKPKRNENQILDRDRDEDGLFKDRKLSSKTERKKLEESNAIVYLNG